MPNIFDTTPASASALEAPAHIIPVVSELQLRTLKQSSPDSGPPRGAGLRAKATDGSAAQRWEVEFYPPPIANQTYFYRYPVVPHKLSATKPYAYGGAQHAQTLIAACRAVAEQHRTNQQGVRFQQFLAQLAASVDLDQRISTGQTDTLYQEPQSGTMAALYGDLQRAVGSFFGFGDHPGAFTDGQRRRVDDILRRGLDQFMHPPIIKGETVPHMWGFMKPIATVTTGAGTWEYPCPADFGAMDGDMTFEPNAGYPAVVLVGEQDIRRKRQLGDTSGRPTMVAIRSSTQDGEQAQAFQFVFHPTPDAAYVLSYAKIVAPLPLTAAAPYPWGHAPHGETVRCSCLCIAELELQGKHGAQYEMFIQRLQTSIGYDRRQFQPRHMGQNTDRAAAGYEDTRARLSGKVSYAGTIWD